MRLTEPAWDPRESGRAERHPTTFMSKAYTEHQEAILVVLAQQGDGEAFAELMQRCRTLCLRTARSILHNDVEAEDQLQNAYLKAWKELGSFRRDAKFSTWLVRIVTNQCLMELRRQRRAPVVSMDPAGDQPETIRPILTLEDKRWNHEEELGSRQVARILKEEVARVPGLLRGVLVLTEERRLGIEEVARSIGISVPAAKSRLVRARQELRRRMEKHTGRMGLATITG